MESIKAQQILLPKKVYIGDTAELRCTFNTDSLIFKQLTLNGSTEMNSEVFTGELNYQDYEVLNLSLAPVGINYYQLSINFKAWKTGNITLPPVKIGETEIILDPVSIVSITEQNSISSLRENNTPILLPGTTYKLYGSLILFVILLIIGIRAVIKRKSIMFFIRNQQLLIKYRRNKKQTTKKLKLLALSQDEDKIFAEKYQHLLRKYMEIRFDFPFTKAASSELMKGFLSRTQGLLTDEKEEAFGKIAETFIRTDYIRYSPGKKLKADEKQSIITTTIKQIEILERNEKEVKKNA